MSEAEKTPSNWTEHKPIVIEWEKWRIVYNIILIAVVIYAWETPYSIFHIYGKLLGAGTAIFVSNIFYFAGPAFELYLKWANINMSTRKFIRISLFVLGTALAALFVFVVVGPTDQMLLD